MGNVLKFGLKDQNAKHSDTTEKSSFNTTELSKECVEENEKDSTEDQPGDKTALSLVNEEGGEDFEECNEKDNVETAMGIETINKVTEENCNDIELRMDESPSKESGLECDECDFGPCLDKSTKSDYELPLDECPFNREEGEDIESNAEGLGKDFETELEELGLVLQKTAIQSVGSTSPGSTHRLLKNLEGIQDSEDDEMSDTEVDDINIEYFIKKGCEIEEFIITGKSPMDFIANAVREEHSQETETSLLQEYLDSEFEENTEPFKTSLETSIDAKDEGKCNGEKNTEKKIDKQQDYKKEQVKSDQEENEEESLKQKLSLQDHCIEELIDGTVTESKKQNNEEEDKNLVTEGANDDEKITEVTQNVKTKEYIELKQEATNNYIEIKQEGSQNKKLVAPNEETEFKKETQIDAKKEEMDAENRLQEIATQAQYQ